MPAPTGLTMIGQALSQGAADYANRKLSLEDEARRRQERLSDIQSQRGYEEQVFDKARSLQLSDEQRRRFESLSDAEKRALIENRLNALKEAQSRGLIAVADIGKQAVEDAALQVLGQQLQEEAKFSRAQPGNAAQALAGMQEEEQKVRQKMSSVEAQLSSQPTIDQSRVAARALEIAVQNNGGKTPSRDQIAAATPDAVREAQQQAMVQWMQDKEDAKIQYQLLSSQLNTLRQQQANLTSTFKVAPSPLTPAPVSDLRAEAAIPTRAGNAVGGFLDSLNAEMAKRGLGAQPKPGTPEAAQSNLIQASSLAKTPEEQTILRQANTQRIANEYGKLDEEIAGPRNALAQEQQDIDRQKTLILQGYSPNFQPGLSMGAFAPLADQKLTPEQQSQLLTNLLIREGNLPSKQNALSGQEADIARRRKLLIQPMQFNTPSQVFPVTPPSAGSVLSTR